MLSAHPRPTADAPTPLLLITGFLGSGKTTFINRLLALPGQPKLGVVVNEFGQIGIDGTLLGGGSSDGGSGILELANGCVCCARGTEMWEAALELVDRAGAEVLLVETSGLVEPAALFEQYKLLPPKLARRLELRGLLCLVDAVHVAEALERRPEVKQQLELADKLLFTKLDLATPAQLLRAHQLLDELHATVERASLATTAPAADVANLLRWAMKGAGEAARPQRRHQHDASSPCSSDCQPERHGGKQLSALSLHEPEPLLAAPLLQLLGELRGTVLRAKGVVRLVGALDQLPTAGLPSLETPSTLAALHLVGSQVALEPLSPAAAAAVATQAGSNLVFIGEDLDEDWLRLRLSACRSRAPAAAARS